MRTGTMDPEGFFAGEAAVFELELIFETRIMGNFCDE